MNRIRTILTALALIGATAISVAAAVQAIMTGLPDTPNIDEALVRDVLAKRDISSESPRWQRHMANQLERDLRSGLEWRPTFDSLTPQEQALFLQNIAELARASITHKADIYFRLPEDARRRMLERESDNLMAWAGMLATSAQDDEARGAPLELIVTFQRTVSRWQAESTPEEREQLTKFIGDLAGAMLRRGVQRSMPGTQNGQFSLPH